MQFLDKKTHYFYFVDAGGKRQRYVLIFGDEVEPLDGNAPSGPGYSRVRYRGRVGEWRPPPLRHDRSLEMYFLDVGQGDAAFIVTPTGTKILVDGGLRERALGFLIWKYRLDLDTSDDVVIDHLFLSHADLDHVEGLIPVLEHPRISVLNIHHNGIAQFASGFNTPIGHRTSDDRLVTIHDTVADLDGCDLASGSHARFAEWISAVAASGASYHRRDRHDGVLDIGDPDVTVEIVGPVLEADGSLRWFSDKSHTINGHSLVFRLTHGAVRSFFSGDLNRHGSKQLLAQPNAELDLNAHIFKAPHHGSSEFSEELLETVNPMITVVSSGEIPDHGHPRADFLGTIGHAGRGTNPLLFSTELAALFVDIGEAPAHDAPDRPADIRFSTGDGKTDAHRLFKKLLPGIINVRTDGQHIYAFRRVHQSYQWESYGPLESLH